VLLAPMGDPSRVFASFTAQLGMGPRVRSRLERRVLRTIGLPWAAFDLSAAARTVPVPPTLVVHDRHDREIPFDEGRRIAQAWPDVRLITTDGLGHRRLLRDPGVVDAVVRFVAASGAASPESGRWSA
jgi:pimeloyl-ACP methyl ester carboxylesterase